MTERKRILRRAALIAGGLFLAAGIGLLVSAGLYEAWKQGQKEAREREREQQSAQARDYLAQLAKRIVRLPVDPAVPADVQSKYFEDYPGTRMFVWAMDMKGELLFGVPAEEFARVDKAYERHRVEIEREGFYPDRQAFLRRLIGHPDVDFTAVEGGEQENPGWRAYREDERGWSFFSVPFKAADSSVLGTVYMKLERKRWDQEPRSDLMEGVGGGLGVVTGLSGLFLWFLLPTWVYVDARERGVPRARLWSLLTLISLVIGVIVYLIARPEGVKTLQCPGCGREVNGGAFCPHCGRDLSTAFCSACRYPLKPEWAFCPSCRTEIRRPAAVASTEAPQP